MAMADSFSQAGGCHCGALRYAVSATPLWMYACHCTDCQSLSGAAFAMGVVVSASSFALSGTPRKLERTLGSGLVSQRWICAACGVWICGGSKSEADLASDRRVIRAGTFDDTSWIRPSAHFWTRSAQPWMVFPKDVTIFETQPTA